MRRLFTLAVPFLLFTSITLGVPSRTPSRQGAFDASSMSLEQSVVWLRNTLLGQGKLRLAINAT